MRTLFSFFGDLFRNRRNRACTACLVVFQTWTAFVVVWSAVSLAKMQLTPVPNSVLAMLTLVSGWKGWKDHTDARYPGQPPEESPTA